MVEASGAAVAYLGIDVGKLSHSACAIDAGGEVVFRADLENRPDDIDRLLERAGASALVVVDQRRNIGALVLARAFAHGNPCAYLPGYAEKQARGMFPGVAKTDAIDAEVLARTARGLPGALRPLAEKPEDTASLRILSSQREFAAAARTRAKNRLRATLLEADPALERAVDPSRPWQVALLAEFGSAAGCSAAGWSGFSAAAERAEAPADGARRLWESMAASARSGRRVPAGEDVAVRMLARDIAALDADVAELDGLIADALAGNELYECPLTVPGIGPKTVAALVTSVDISMFRGHDELASYCGVAPAGSRSGTSVRSTSPQRGGNKQLKNLLIFSCNSLVSTQNRFGRYYDEGDEAQQGAEGRGEKEAQGHLRRHAGRGPVLGLNGRATTRRAAGRTAPRCIMPKIRGKSG